MTDTKLVSGRARTETGPVTPPDRPERTRLRRVLGDDVDRRLLPLLSSIAIATAAHYLVLAFVSVYAVTELDVSGRSVGLAFAVGGVSGALGGWLGGLVSDRRGRRGTILGGLAVNAAALTVLAAAPRWPVVVAVLGLHMAFGSARWTAQGAAMIDLLAGDAHAERGFAAQRVAFNLGAASAPLLGALLVLWSFDALFAFAAVAMWLAVAVSLGLPGARPTRSAVRRASPRILLRDRAFGLLFVAALLSWLVYNTFEVVFPVVLTDGHGYAPATWGVLATLNPIMVIFLQMRMTRWFGERANAARLALAMLLMGLPFSLLSLTDALPVVVLIVIVFVLGEILVGPPQQALLARLAPAELRGLYSGTLFLSLTIALAVGPATSLAVRDAWGENALWALLAVIAAVGALLFVAACRAVERRDEVGHDRAAVAAG